MARLVDGLSHFFGRVEILARGAEGERRAAEEALAKGRPLEAREHAMQILARVPGSPLGLAIWADAAEDAWLDEEVVAALSELAKAAPWRADVWLRLGRAGLRVGWPDARDALERAASAPEERDASRLALLDLCDLDLAADDTARALRWLDRVPAPLEGADRDASLRRAEHAIATGDLDRARRAAASMDPELEASGRGSLVRAHLALADGQPEAAVDHALAAFILDAPRSAALLASLVAAARDVVIVDRVRRVVKASGSIDEPAWAAAFAFAEGRRDDARRALARGLSAGDPSAATALLGLARETRDLDALHTLATRDEALLPPDLAALRDAAVLLAEGREAAALDRLDVVHGDAAAWASDLRAEAVARWFPAPGEEGAELAWPKVLSELRRAAKSLDRLDLVGAIEALAVERERPLRVAVVGEFNAGKSTFLNALLGVDVAPTGVLPTTATLHWVAWADYPFARIVVRGAEDRVVPHEGLKPALKALDAAGTKVERVLIHAPIERLQRVEIIDTPGFNAPDPEHLEAARRAIDEAHVAVWLLDATGPLKETERRVLAHVRDLGVPIQILINKADRLAPGAIDKVLEHVEAGLADAHIASHAPPVAFSARLALRGKLGDAEALAASRWSVVEALFAERIVDASAGLREHALRRKARAVAVELATLAEARAQVDSAAARAARDERERLRAAAAKLAREGGDLAVSIDRGLEAARAVLRKDLRPVAELSDDRRRRDPDVRAYVVERVVARLSEPVALAIAAAAGLAPSPATSAAVRAVLVGAASALDAPTSLVDRPIDRVVRGGIDAFAAALLAAADLRVPEPPSAALEQRVVALRGALAASFSDSARRR